MKSANGEKKWPGWLLLRFVKMVIIQRHITSIINDPVRFIMQVHVLGACCRESE